MAETAGGVEMGTGIEMGRSRHSTNCKSPVPEQSGSSVQHIRTCASALNVSDHSMHACMHASMLWCLSKRCWDPKLNRGGIKADFHVCKFVPEQWFLKGMTTHFQ